MTIEQFVIDNLVTVIIGLAIIGVWEIIWTGIALYLAGKREQKAWFVWILIINSVGILPIIYLIMNRESKKKKKIQDYKGADGR